MKKYRFSRLICAFTFLISVFTVTLHPTAVVAAEDAVELTISGTKSEVYAREVFEIVNRERAANGVAALQWDTAIEEAVMLRAAELVVYYSHTRPDGTSCFTALDVSYSTAGENIAVWQTDPEEVMTDWMNSEGHRNNILNSNFKSMAVGCYLHNGHYHWVQMFTSRVPSVQPDDPVDSAAKYTIPILKKWVTLSFNFSSDLELGVGKSMTASAKLTNAGWTYASAILDVSTVNFSSSDTSVLSVDANGKMTGVSEGTAVVTLSLKNDSSLSAQLNVTVSESVTPITMTVYQRDTASTGSYWTFSKLSMKKGSGVEFLIRVSPTGVNEAITCSATDESIISWNADSNIITAIAPGTTTVTLALVEDPSVKKVFDIVITSPATDISIPVSEKEISVSETFLISAAVVPSDSTDTISYKSSDSSIATVDSNGLVTGVSSGTVTITVSAGDVEKSVIVTVVEVVELDTTLFMVEKKEAYKTSLAAVEKQSAAVKYVGTRTYAPVRAVGNAAGFDVLYISDDEIILTAPNGDQYVLAVGSTEVRTTIDGTDGTQAMLNPPVIINGKLYTPIRALSELAEPYGYGVEYVSYDSNEYVFVSNDPSLVMDEVENQNKENRETFIDAYAHLITE